MKPKIQSEVQEFRLWGRPKPLRLSVRWLVSCPCKRDRYLAVAGSWDAALEIALLHGRTFHAHR